MSVSLSVYLCIVSVGVSVAQNPMRPHIFACGQSETLADLMTNNMDNWAKPLLTVVNTEDDTVVFMPQVHERRISTIAFSYDGNLMVSMGQLSVSPICVWDWRRAVLVGTYTHRHPEIISIAWSPAALNTFAIVGGHSVTLVHVPEIAQTRYTDLKVDKGPIKGGLHIVKAVYAQKAYAVSDTNGKDVTEAVRHAITTANGVDTFTFDSSAAASDTLLHCENEFFGKVKKLVLTYVDGDGQHEVTWDQGTGRHTISAFRPLELTLQTLEVADPPAGVFTACRFNAAGILCVGSACGQLSLFNSSQCVYSFPLPLSSWYVCLWLCVRLPGS
jgi:hypothetical protein